MVGVRPPLTEVGKDGGCAAGITLDPGIEMELF
jgi:hypothetical protein